MSGPSFQVKLTQEELAIIIQQTQSKLEDLEVEEENDGADENGDFKEEDAAEGAATGVKEEEIEENESEDVIKKYRLDNYDDEGKP
jgi:hypothetical protein